ncbi:hypothetical protein ES703_01369 [subsurface metagenome]
MKKMSLVILLLGVVAVVLGAVFIGQGVARNNQLVEAMHVEQVTLGIESELEGEIIDSLEEAMEAGDTIREHRRGIAPTYSDLLGDGRYDPTDPQQLTYAQALNLENYLYLAVVAFGLTQSVTASGVFMVVTGLALGGTGVVLYRLGQRVS